MKKSRNYRTIKLIKFYQKHKRISGRCHFIPSCSNYAIEAYQKFNWFYASLLTGMRILRCNPFARRKVDLVPLSKEEKKRAKILKNLKQQNDSLYIDTVLKHSKLYSMESIDYIILTIEYLYGINLFNGTSTYKNIEYLGNKYVRCNYQFEENNCTIDKNYVQQYLDILILLNNNNFICFDDCTWDLHNLKHSFSYTEKYPTDYFVCQTKDLSITFWKKEIERFFSTKTIIGLENIDKDILSYFQKEWQAAIINSSQLTHKLIHSITNSVIIVIGDNMANPRTSYFLNCLVRFYEKEEIFDLNKYNIIIPK